MDLKDAEDACAGGDPLPGCESDFEEMDMCVVQAYDAKKGLTAWWSRMTSRPSKLFDSDTAGIPRWCECGGVPQELAVQAGAGPHARRRQKPSRPLTFAEPPAAGPASRMITG